MEVGLPFLEVKFPYWLDEAPIWWQNFMYSKEMADYLGDIKAIKKILHEMGIEYDGVTITFKKEEDFLFFKLKY